MRVKSSLPAEGVTTSLSRVLKSSNIVLDKDKRVKIKIGAENEEFETNFGDAEDNEWVETDLAVKEKLPDPKVTLEKAKEEAERMVERARQRAEKITMDATIEAQSKVAQMYEDGKAQGYQDGLAEGRAEADRVRQEAQGYLNKVKSDCEELIRKQEPNIVELILRIVQKLLGDIPELKPEVIAALVRQGLSEVSISGEVVIHVSVEDYDAAVANRHLFLPYEGEGSARFDIVKDGSLSRGDCTIETPFGNIDCSLDQQFASLKKDIYLLLEHR